MADFKIAEAQTGRNENLVDALNMALLKRSAELAIGYVAKNEKQLYSCNQDGCQRKGYAKGLCHTHYKRSQLAMDMSLPIKNRKGDNSCKSCQKKLNGKGGWNLCQQHYKKERFDIIKNILIDHLGGKCSKCFGTFNNCVYDFHHLRDKKFEISKSILNISIDELVKEVEKCILLCANCHRILHHG